MKPTLQPGMHPDAETLTAFAEQLVTGAEREEVLAHMAECGRCREVVFIAQRAAEVEQPVQNIREVSDERPRRGWSLNWRWAWIPVAAVAGIVGIAIIQHERHRSVTEETRLAQNAAPPEVMQGQPPSKTAEKAPPAEPQLGAEAKQKMTATARTDRDAESDRRALDQKDVAAVAEKKEEAAQQVETQPVAPRGLSGGAVHGTFAARAKSSSVGGPMAQNQVQQQNNAQLQQLDVNEAQQAASIAATANRPAPSSQSGAPSQSVKAQADAAIVPASPAPAASPALAAKSTQSETVEVSGHALDKLKVVPESLPSKLGVLSQTRSGKTIVAIDTAGSVFASDDGGKRWQSANTQWSGRPILVKTRPASESGGAGLLKQSTPRFELTTDKHEIWVSEDGKNWTLEPLTGR